MTEAETRPPMHPVQDDGRLRAAPQTVTLRAYEVYCEIWSPQEALITGHCRGGFDVVELIALLYARTFPRAEWRQRFDEAIMMEKK